MKLDLDRGCSRLARAIALSTVLLGSAAVAQTPAAPPAATPAAPAAVPANPDAVVATVNGETLTERELQIAVDELAPGGTVLDEQKREQVISFLINVKLVAKAAADAKLGEGPDFAARLEFLREKALMQVYLEKLGKDAATEAAVKQVYEETIKDIKPEQEVRARHVLVETEDEAKKVAERIAKGEDFAAVAKEASKDPGSGAEGGDLGFFSKEQMVPEFAEAAFAMEAGKVSAPVKSQYGWHIIKVEEKRERPIPKLEEVRAQIEDYLHKKAQEEAVKKLLADAKVERTGAPKAEQPAPAPAAK